MWIDITSHLAFPKLLGTVFIDHILRWCFQSETISVELHWAWVETLTSTQTRNVAKEVQYVDQLQLNETSFSDEGPQAALDIWMTMQTVVK